MPPKTAAAKEVVATTAAADTTALPQKLQKPAAAVQALESSHAERLLLSRHSGEELARSSLAALYSLAEGLHSKQLPFHAKRLTTSKAQHVTLEQIWGQMNVLLRPVLRRLQDNVRNAQRTFGPKATEAKPRSTPKAKPALASKAKKEKANTTHKDPTPALPSEDDDDDEDELDEEMAALMAQVAARRAGKKAGKAALETGGNDDSHTGGEDWRYAFGRHTTAEDEDEWGEAAEDTGRASEQDGDESSAPKRRSTKRRRGQEEEHEEEEDEDDTEEALRMMYGDDFQAEGTTGLIGEDEDPDMAADIELDDPNYEEGEELNGDMGNDEAGEAALFRPQDGNFYGKYDILNDEEDEDGGTGLAARTEGEHDADNEDDAAMDEELQRALQDPSLTELQRSQLRERHLIAKLEEKRLYGTDWAMTGETAASKRPREALLSAEGLEFDYGMKAVPVITEAVTAKLEDRIKRRILEKQYDDVTRRAPTTTAADLVTTKKPDAALEGTKSKLSLMDLYEKEYTEKMRRAEEEAATGPEASAAEPLTEIEKDELRAIQMWRRLAQHLDALSNFYYTPKPVQQELEARVRAVEGQTPAIALETVGNFATTRESALAPQDVYRASHRRFVAVGSAEMTPQERRALRRSRKDDGQRVKAIKESHQQRKAKAKEQQKAAAAAAAAAA